MTLVSPTSSQPSAPSRHAIGCMTGTSLDGLDAAMVRAAGKGVGLEAEVVGSASAAFTPDLSKRLRAVCDGEPFPAEAFARIGLELGELHASVCHRLVADTGTHPDLVCLHGQTVVHAPPVSWQLINPWPVARAMNCAVASDLRGLDLAHGGQGAPITPLADLVLFGSPDEPRALVNLGGFSNITLLPAGRLGGVLPEGFDACPCNHVLDAVARARLGVPFDDRGSIASAGTVDEQAAAALASRLVPTVARSLGSGDDRASEAIDATRTLSPSDALATACAAIGSVIGGAISSAVLDHRRDSGHAGPAVFLSGGGARNDALRAAIASALKDADVGGLETTEALGIAVHDREAAGMAVLGLLSVDRVEITLRNVTGRSPVGVQAGQWILPKGIWS